jgi:transcription elongation factor GreB
MQVSRRKIEELRRRDSGPVHVTEEGLKRLREELSRLKEKMPGFIAEAQRTAAYGDRSDNAEYKEAKATLRRAQGRIFGLEDQIRRAEIIAPGSADSGVVRLGSTVVLEVVGLENGKKSELGQKTFRILGPRETDPAKGIISYKSPLGAALVNRAKGDTVTIAPVGGPVGNPPVGGDKSKKYRIVEIR